MSLQLQQTRIGVGAHRSRSRSRLPVSWVTVALCAVVIAYVDGFWLTSLQGAVGAIERNQPPLMRWLRDSTLMLPLFFLAIVGALLLARRWVGQSRRELVKLGATALLVIGIGSAVGIAEVAASSAYDYKLQTTHLQLGQHLRHADGVPTDAASTTSACDAACLALHVNHAAAGGPCDAFCSARQATLRVHVRAVKLASGVLLLSNIVLVAFVLAVRGGRLWLPDAAVGVTRQNVA
jgi:hypothetical protein